MSVDSHRVVPSDRVVPFLARDGVACNLIQVRGARAPDKGPVLLVHGAGVRANIFRAPVQATVVDLLLDAGYDVWMENWRASIDLPACRWTIDQAALYDHPAAVETVVRETGATTVKAIVHCQGSTSFCLSAALGLLPQVTTVVSNAVSFHTIVPLAARVKGVVSVPLLAALTPFLNPQWGLHAPTFLAKVLNGAIRLTHHECDNIVCRWSSFAYGVGFPTLWRHENLNEATHEWLEHEFAAVPLSFFQQMARCLSAGHLVAYDGGPDVPADPIAAGSRTDARFVFFTGAKNRCFLPESQQRSFAWLDAQRPGYHALHVIPDYGHLDIFMGQHAHRDVLPLMVQALDRPSGIQRATSTRSTVSPCATDNGNPLAPETLVMTAVEPGISFRETMQGHFSLGATDPEQGRAAGERERTTLAMHVTVTVRDLDRFVEDPNHNGSLSGTIDFAPLGLAMPTGEGVFRLFAPATEPATTLMVYELPFEHAGQAYYLAGAKKIHDDPGFDLWSDTTTLYTRLHAGTDAGGTVVGAGVLRLDAVAFAKVAASVRAVDADSPVEAARLIAQFGGFFAGELWKSYVAKPST